MRSSSSIRSSGQVAGVSSLPENTRARNERKNAQAMKTDFLSDVVNAVHPLPVEVLSLADATHLNAQACKLPWHGLNIDWSNQQHQIIDLSQAGEYSSDSIPQETLRRFRALHGQRVVMMFSAYEPPVAMAVDDFVENWSVIFTGLFFLPKLILVAADELGAEDPGMVEIDPMVFIKGHVQRLAVPVP